MAQNNLGALRQNRSVHWILVLLFLLIPGTAMHAVASPDDVLISADGQSEFPPDIQRILDAGKLRVSMYFMDVPPFFMVTQSGQFAGIDVALARDIAHHLGVEVEFMREPKTFDEVAYAVAERKADVAISQLSDTRSELYGFAFPIVMWSLTRYC